MTDKPTIAALATPAGESAIALVRVSGPLCAGLAKDAFGRYAEPDPRKANLGKYRDLAGNILDEALYTLFEEGHSYTGEGTLEIACHGNPLIARKILEDLQARGCRLAEPGEFTRTAFLNGKMDLSQAEAVMELIHAKSEKALKVAHRHLRGGIGDKIRGFINKLTRLCAHLEAYIDFPEEDLPEEDQSGPLAELSALLQAIDRLIDTHQYHDALTQGVRLAILGAPNAGKSSLLNALLDQDRAIVSDIPGTTRDFISERITFGGLNLELIDTAGLRNPASDLESQGIERSLQVAGEADFTLLVLDSSEAPPELPKEALQNLTPENAIVCENKTDLPNSQTFPGFQPALPHLRISALTSEGLGQLKQHLHERLEALVELPGEATVVVNARHRQLLSQGRQLLLEGRQKLQDHIPAELAASDLREALETLAQITGSFDTEDLLDVIFQDFCIGK